MCRRDLGPDLQTCANEVSRPPDSGPLEGGWGALTVPSPGDSTAPIEFDIIVTPEHPAGHFGFDYWQPGTGQLRSVHLNCRHEAQMLITRVSTCRFPRNNKDNLFAAWLVRREAGL